VTADPAHAGAAPPTFPVADLERRFVALALDRGTSWSLYVVAATVGWLVWGRDGLWWTAAIVVGLALLVVLVNGILTGVSGATPGKRATALRVVDHGTGLPLGVGRGTLRSLVLGLSGLPTLGFGLAALAWTALAGSGGQRRGWHDQVTGSVVVDLRPQDAATEAEDEGPRHVVNLTAMRLVPATAQTPPVVPAAPRPVPPPAPAQVPAAQVPASQVPAAQVPPAPQPQHAAPPVPTTPVTHRPPVPPGPLAPQAPQTPPANQAPYPPNPFPPAPARPAAAPPAAQPVPQAPPPAPAAPAPAAYASADQGRTVARSASQAARPTGPRWRVRFDTGEELVVEGLALVGRRPEPRNGEQVRHVVPLPSSDMSLSKTHAQFGLAPDGALVVMDRGSTNGSLLLRQGVARELNAGKPATLLPGDRVRFGDREMTVQRDA
jgi:uncharacterized RDD family membrane protein YckC